MATGNFTEGEVQTKTLLEELGLSPYLVHEFHQQSFSFSAVHIYNLLLIFFISSSQKAANRNTITTSLKYFSREGTQRKYNNT